MEIFKKFMQIDFPCKCGRERTAGIHCPEFVSTGSYGRKCWVSQNSTHCYSPDNLKYMEVKYNEAAKG